MKDARILDACCGSRMFWFNREHPDTIFADNRRGSHQLTDMYAQGGKRSLIVDPDLEADFTALPFKDETFWMVVFDPPHLIVAGKSGWLAKKYGKLESTWQSDLRAGFEECFRVLKTNGTLCFKWNESQIPLSRVLPLAGQAPLFGSRGGKSNKTHWLVFLK